MFLASIAFGVLLGTPNADGATVFSTDFDSGLPAELSAPGATIVPVEGFAGYGAGSNTFDGSFLRYDDGQVLDTELTLTDLPPHDRLTLGFLLDPSPRPRRCEANVKTLRGRWPARLDRGRTKTARGARESKLRPSTVPDAAESAKMHRQHPTPPPETPARRHGGRASVDAVGGL